MNRNEIVTITDDVWTGRGKFQGELHQTTGATFADPFHFTCNSTSPDFNLIFVMFHLVLGPIQCQFFSSSSI